MKLIRGEFLLSPQKDIPLNWNCGSLFHGAFMQRLDPSYGEALHRSGLKPFSQYLTCAPEECKWVFQTLTEDAEQQIWEQPSIQEWNEIYLEQKNATFKIKERSITVLSEEDLMQRTFFGNCARRVSISKLPYHPPHFSKLDQQVRHGQRKIANSLSRTFRKLGTIRQNHQLFFAKYHLQSGGRPNSLFYRLVKVNAFRPSAICQFMPHAAALWHIFRCRDQNCPGYGCNTIQHNNKGECTWKS